MNDTYIALGILFMLGVFGFLAIWFPSSSKSYSPLVNQIAEDVERNGQAKWLLTVTLDEQKKPIVKIERYEET